MSCPEDFPTGYHIGHLLFKYLSLYADRICQIDAVTGEEESYASVLKRSIQLAKALRAFCLKPGDILSVGGFNHLDICIPLYAALFNGLPVIGVDPYYEYDEVHALFSLTRPKIAFCPYEFLNIYTKAAEDIGLDLKIVTFCDGDCTMKKFMEIYGTIQKDENDFILPTELEEVICRHPGVKDVCVVAVMDPFDVQMPGACVVRQNGSDVTALDIKNLVERNLSKNKRLRGGVVFLDNLPYTSSGKIARLKLSTIVMRLERE